jgi:hypothetical protein
MADLKLLDRVFYLITQHFVVTGQAPHYTELAKVLSLSVEESRKLLHELMEAPTISFRLRPLTVCPLSIASP